MTPCTPQERMATVIAREVRDGETVAVGTLAPVPASGVLLAHFTHAPRARVVLLNHPDYWPFRQGSKEFYDFAQRGGFDLFFLSGGQIDRHGNLNLIAVGDVERPRVRLPGGAGSAMLYYLARRVIPGSSPPEVARPGGPWKVVTPLCVFRFDRERKALVVESVHPGVTREELARRTGFALDDVGSVEVIPEPTSGELHLLRTRVREAVAKTYPQFAETAFTR
ncbi:MAG: hypothetical protein AUG00_03085 [Candidatus Rokubacteria bacterium 13_1_20CM_2_70_7]|nr:MAG: hypothetical protein AUG00_03085 [Candidatus Rokubacteria bacterium 13_1_20CM_2_70_7]